MELLQFGELLKIQLLSWVTLLLTAAAIGHMLSTKRKPKSMIAWILVILTMPYIGIPLYIVFSGRKIEKSILSKGQLILHSYAPSDFTSQMSLFLTSQKIPPPTGHNRVVICKDGIEAYERLIEMLTHAKRYIYISTYIFGDDEVTSEIIDILSIKAQAGVEVKLLIDSLGSLKLELYPATLQRLRKAGGEYYFFNSFVHNPIDFKMNLRNHRKSIIVDGHTVMAGGMNIAKEYLSPVAHDKLWKDLSFVLTGEATQHYLDIFLFDWEYTTSEELKPQVEMPAEIADMHQLVQVVPSGPDVENDAYFEAMIYAPFLAQERIWIVTPYFAPDQTIIDALIVARHRGVEIRIVVPDTSDHFMIDLVRNGFLRELQQEGVAVYFYKNRMLHAKMVLVDDSFAVMGSANFDERSFFYNYETMSFFYSKEQIEAAQKWMEEVLLESTQGLAPASRLRMVMENSFKMFAPAI
jgi:cardiolipin synthase